MGWGGNRISNVIRSSSTLALILVVAWGPMVVRGDGKPVAMQELLPQGIEGYTWDGKDQRFDRNTIFRYMDGAAEFYLTYQFKSLLVRRYLRGKEPPMMVELFEMGSSEDAFGVFSFDTEGDEMGVGQGSDYGGGLLRFWKGRFFVNVYEEQETSETKQRVLAIGRAIARSIQSEGTMPKLIQCLPQKNLLNRSVRYFHHPLGLNHHYFVSHENILHLGDQTNAVLASYLFPGTRDKTLLLVIQFSSRKLAETALRSFVKAYMPESPTSRIIQTESGKWTAAHSAHTYVMIVFDAPLKEKAEEMIQATSKRLGTAK